jgi:HD-GYP domain-containing protein (c-di-GMP phosphodiesterase class II)
MYRKVKSADLRIGMFVADLDRPWIDTPFLLQGFLIEDREQLDQVVECCAWVMIDPQRSIGSAYEPLPKPKPLERREVHEAPLVVVTKVAAPVDGQPEGDEFSTDSSQRSTSNKKTAQNDKQTNAPAKGRTSFAVAMRASTQPDEPGESGNDENFTVDREAIRARLDGGTKNGERKRGFFSQLKESARNLFLTKQKDDIDYSNISDEYDTPKPYVRPSFIPETVQLTIYEDKLTVEEEIQFAHEAFTRTNDLLHRVTEDIRSGGALQLEDVEAVIDDMVESMVRNPDAMMWVARLREQNMSTYGHGLSVAVNLVAFGRHLGYPKQSLSHLGLLGMLLDLGKIKIPSELLEKHERLTPAEFDHVKQHVQFGLDILHKTPNIHSDVLDGVAQHHERMNGKGYPFGLVGEKITVFGRMAGIADSYAAMTQQRNYAETASPHEALQTMSSYEGTQFHSEMLEQFIQSIGAFPVGSLVELSTGEVAVVATHNKLKRLKPKVMIITEADKTVRKFPTTKDLLYDVSEKPVYIRRGLPPKAFGLDVSEFYLQ